MALEADELVTKQFLRGEMAQLGAELRGEMAQLGAELRADIGEVRTDLAQLESRVMVRMGAAMAAQTTVLLAVIGLLRGEPSARAECPARSVRLDRERRRSWSRALGRRVAGASVDDVGVPANPPGGGMRPISSSAAR